MYVDKYGLVDETYLSLRYPRRVDDTAPTLKDALVTAGRMLFEGAEKVSICTTKKGREIKSLITLFAHEEIEEDNFE